MKRGRIQAKDISEETILAVVDSKYPEYTTLLEFLAALDLPEKPLIARLDSMSRRGILDDMGFASYGPWQRMIHRIAKLEGHLG